MILPADPSSTREGSRQPLFSEKCIVLKLRLRSE